MGHAGQLPPCHVTFLFLPRYPLTGDVGELGSGKRETGARTLHQGARVPGHEGRPILPPGPRRGPSPAWVASPPPPAPLPRCGPPDTQGQSSVLHTFAAMWSSGHCPLVMRQNYVPGGKQDHPVPSAPKHVPRVSKQCQKHLIRVRAFPERGLPALRNPPRGPSADRSLAPASPRRALQGTRPVSLKPLTPRHLWTPLTVTISPSF